MRRIRLLFNISLFALLLASACTDPTDVGADLLEDDEAEVGFTDTLSVLATTLRTDTLLTYFPAKSAAEANINYLVGEMVDPIFGRSKSQIYAQVSLRSADPDFDASAKLDSIVLVLPYDQAGVYGDLTETYGLSVHQLTTFIDPAVKYYSNQSFPSEAMPLGSKEFVPNLDSITIKDYVVGIKDSLYQVGVPAQLRIPLDQAFGQELINLDTNLYADNNNVDSLLVQYLKGLHIKPTTTNRGMLSFNLMNSRAGIYLYYTETDTVKKQIQFDFNFFWVRQTKQEHDYNGTVVEKYFDSTTLGDSLIFVQGMAGTLVELEIPFAEQLEGLVVNKAELEMRVATLPGDDGNVYKPVPLLILLTPNEDGEFESIDDISLIIIRLGLDRLEEYYGGDPRDSNAGEPKVYRFNMSTHFQKVINKSRKNILRLVVFNQLQQPARVALYGAKHPQYGIKLKVAFTKPPGK